MKRIAIVFFLSSSIIASGNNPYHAYLLSKLFVSRNQPVQAIANRPSGKSNCTIAGFERPKGAVFCRMEDYLTAKTKVWIKIGVK